MISLICGVFFYLISIYFIKRDQITRDEGKGREGELGEKWSKGTNFQLQDA